MFPLSRSTARGDLHSAGVSRVIARPLRHTGPHHSRRGHPHALFLHWAGYSGYYEDTSPREPGNVARLVTCLSSSSSMLSGTPGVGDALVDRARTAWPAPAGKGSAPHQTERFSGLRVRCRATPFTSLLSRVLLSASADSRNATERLTRPYPGGPARYRGLPRDRQPLPGCPMPPLPSRLVIWYGPSL